MSTSLCYTHTLYEILVSKETAISIPDLLFSNSPASILSMYEDYSKNNDKHQEYKACKSHTKSYSQPILICNIRGYNYRRTW